jgi:hypothetical protein
MQQLIGHGPRLPLCVRSRLTKQGLERRVIDSLTHLASLSGRGWLKTTRMRRDGISTKMNAGPPAPTSVYLRAKNLVQ